MINKLINIFKENKTQDIQDMFKSILGYFPYDITNDKILPLTDNEYEKNIRRINLLEKKYNADNVGKKSVIPILLNLYKAKTFYLFSQVDKATLFLNEAKFMFQKINDNINQEGIDFLSFNISLMALQISVYELSLDCESELSSYKSKINFLENEIITIRNQQNQFEIHTPEEINLSQIHLEKFLELNKLLVIKDEGNIISQKNKSYGTYLLNQIENILNNKNYEKVMSKYSLLKILVSIEKAKLNFYTEKKPEISFYCLADICKKLVELKIDDPIAYILGEFWCPIIKNNNNNFNANLKSYMYSFVVGIDKTSHSVRAFKMKQMSNFVASNVTERLKIIENYNEKKYKVR